MYKKQATQIKAEQGKSGD